MTILIKADEHKNSKAGQAPAIESWLALKDGTKYA